MPKLSIIVPVYNQRKYLQRCVDSLLEQTFNSIEIILVDDGSTDGSSGLCDEYESRNESIRTIHKENGGLSSARNAGIRSAFGEYISFIDSDDWIEKDTYAYCFKLMQCHDAEIAKINYIYAYSENQPVKNKKEKIIVLDEKEILQNYMYETTRTGSYGVCWYVLPRSIVENEFFRENKINEDIDYVYRILAKCRKIVISNQIKYFYFQKQASLSTGGLKRKDFDLYDAAEELCRLADKETYGTIRKLAELKRARTPLSLLCKIAYYGIQDDSLDKNTIVNKLQSELRKSLGMLVISPIAVSRKALAILFSINYPMTERIVRTAKNKITRNL